MERRLRVQFVHGLESSPQGVKARYFAQRFEAVTPAMDTGDWLGCLALQEAELARFGPDVLVGSSFGGAVVVELMRRGVWRGATLLLAQAARKLAPTAALPPASSALLVHGTRDAVVDPAHSRALAATGDPARVRLIEVDDDHRLSATSAGERLAELVREAYRLAQ